MVDFGFVFYVGKFIRQTENNSYLMMNARDSSPLPLPIPKPVKQLAFLGMVPGWKF